MEGTSQTSSDWWDCLYDVTQDIGTRKGAILLFLDMMLFIPLSNAWHQSVFEVRVYGQQEWDISDGAEDTKEYWEEEIEFLEARLRGEQGEIDAEDRSSCEEALKIAKANLASLTQHCHLVTGTRKGAFLMPDCS